MEISSSNSSQPSICDYSPPQKKVALLIKSSEGDIWEVEHSVASQMGAYKRLINDIVLDLPDVKPYILWKVIQYCKMHAGDYNPNPVQLKIWDQDFVNKLSVDTLFDLIKAANHMDIRSLINLTCQTMAHYIKLMDVEKVRHLFWEVNDFTPQEQHNFRTKHCWAFK